MDIKYENTFIYFGAIAPLSELSNNMKRNRKMKQDIYCYINDFNIQYRRVGNVRTTWRIVFGKELFFTKGNLFNVKDSPYYKIIGNDIIEQYKLTAVEENEIIRKVRKAGSLLPLKYYIIYNFYWDNKEYI